MVLNSGFWMLGPKIDRAMSFTEMHVLDPPTDPCRRVMSGTFNALEIMKSQVRVYAKNDTSFVINKNVRTPCEGNMNIGRWAGFPAVREVLGLIYIAQSV
jgi:hypothetical protein